MITKWKQVDFATVSFNGYSKVWGLGLDVYKDEGESVVEKYNAIYLNFNYPVKIRETQCATDYYLYHLRISLGAYIDTIMESVENVEEGKWYVVEYELQIELFENEIDLDSVSSINNPDGSGVVIVNSPLMHVVSMDDEFPKLSQTSMRYDFTRYVNIPISIGYDDTLHVTEDTIFKAAKIRPVETRHLRMLYTSFNYEWYIAMLPQYDNIQQIPAEIPIVF